MEFDSGLGATIAPAVKPAVRKIWRRETMADFLSKKSSRCLLFLIGARRALRSNAKRSDNGWRCPIFALEPCELPYLYGCFFALAELSGGFPNTSHVDVAIVTFVRPIGRG